MSDTKNITTKNHNKIYKQNPTNIKWFLLRSYGNGIEKLINHLKTYNQLDLLVEIFEPQQCIKSIKDHKIKYQNFYPGYVLIAFDIAHHAELANVANLLVKDKYSNQLSEITNEKIIAIRQIVLKYELDPQISLEFKAGDMVRITSGNYKDMEGNIIKLNTDNQTCEMDIQALGHSVRVTVNINHIENNSAS